MPKKPFKSRLTPGQLVVIYFKDHCFSHWSTSEPIAVKVAGFLIEENETCYKLENFKNTENPCLEHGGSDGYGGGDSYTVLKHPGVRVVQCKEPKR